VAGRPRFPEPHPRRRPGPQRREGRRTRDDRRWLPPGGPRRRRGATTIVELMQTATIAPIPTRIPASSARSTSMSSMSSRWASRPRGGPLDLEVAEQRLDPGLDPSDHRRTRRSQSGSMSCATVQCGSCWSRPRARVASGSDPLGHRDARVVRQSPTLHLAVTGRESLPRFRIGSAVEVGRRGPRRLVTTGRSGRRLVRAGRRR
jgi:hypothetical protein